MKAVAINGSPRRKWNTAQLLESALQGAREAGAQTELVHLYGVEFTGCVSCFECKKIGGDSYGRCAARDGLAPILERALEADVLLLGTPVYFGSETGMMRCFLERLLFPLVTYTPQYERLYDGPARAALLYTMNITDQELAPYGQDQRIAHTQNVMARVFGSCELLLATDTLQFTDYDKYLSTRFDPEAKKTRHETTFPQTLTKAQTLGRTLAQRDA